MAETDERGKRKPLIFISYRHRDADAAAKVSTLCEQAGLEPWTDRRVEAGSDWRREVEAAVERCDVVLLLISAPDLQAELTSPFEWSAICERRWRNPDLPVVPILLDPAPLPPFLAECRSLTAPDERALSRCVDTVCDVSLGKSLVGRIGHPPTGAAADTVARFKHLFEAVSKSSGQDKADSDTEPTKK
jgi:hypothetical protein